MKNKKSSKLASNKLAITKCNETKSQKASFLWKLEQISHLLDYELQCLFVCICSHSCFMMEICISYGSVAVDKVTMNTFHSFAAQTFTSCGAAVGTCSSASVEIEFTNEITNNSRLRYAAAASAGVGCLLHFYFVCICDCLYSPSRCLSLVEAAADKCEQML